jgi:hypothetical protein
VTVAAGGRLVLHGSISGNLVVAAGGEAFLYGKVSGTLTNYGTANVAGTILNGINQVPEANTNISEGAKVTGGLRRLPEGA